MNTSFSSFIKGLMILSLVSAQVGLSPSGTITKPLSQKEVEDALANNGEGQQIKAKDTQVTILQEVDEEEGFVLNLPLGSLQSLWQETLALHQQIKTAQFNERAREWINQEEVTPSREEESQTQGREEPDEYEFTAEYFAEEFRKIEQGMDDLLREDDRIKVFHPEEGASKPQEKEPGVSKNPGKGPAPLSLKEILAMDKPLEPVDLVEFVTDVAAFVAGAGPAGVAAKRTLTHALSSGVKSAPKAFKSATSAVKRGFLDYLSQWNKNAARNKVPDFLKHTERPADKGGGLKWLDNKGNYIRIDKGDPNANYASNRIDHVHIQSRGKVIGRDGKPIMESKETPYPADAPESHIPLNEWRKWKEWDRP